MELSALQAFMTVLLAGCAAIIALGGAIAAIMKFWKWAHRDTEKNTSKLDDVMNWLSSDKRRIEKLEKTQVETAEQNRLMLKAIVALMSHELDGNHTKQLTEARNDIENYLYGKIGG